MKVMLADDEEAIRTLVAAILEDEGGYEMIVAKDGEQAIELARREKPDLLFLDVMMPKVDGYEVCRALKCDPATSTIKIVMLTAMSQDFERNKGMLMGADDYFTKPFSAAALLNKCEEVLGPREV